jgi:hypothetical protein
MYCEGDVREDGEVVNKIARHLDGSLPNDQYPFAEQCRPIQRKDQWAKSCDEFRQGQRGMIRREGLR